MLDEFIKDINELIEYKKKYEYILKDKQKMSDALYELYLEKYNNQSFEERRQLFVKDTCGCCKYYFDCDKHLSKNVLMPIKSDTGWFPSRVGCDEFQWS